MKLSTSLSLILALSAPGFAIAQSGDMKSMDMGKMAEGTAPKAMRHQATGVVKAVDPVKGTVTLAHGPVKSLQWTAMTMRFAVKDKTLFDQLTGDKKVTVEFVKQDVDYVVTAVK
ncbi:MAG: copper-binding protein [Oxalobacteraceae bacterium]|nr:copper-binding protein [Oxalobacteraceae bacterium]